MLSLTTDSISWQADASGETLMLRSPRARGIAAQIDAGKTYEVTIKEYRKKRSLDANAYAWVLIDRISEHLNISRSEVYRNAILDVGGVSDTVCVLERAADALCEGWRHNGIGWMAEKMPSKLDGCINVTLFYGSSVYDTAQMSRLIDILVQEAKSLGIETLTPEELARLEGYGG